MIYCFEAVDVVWVCAFAFFYFLFARNFVFIDISTVYAFLSGENYPMIRRRWEPWARQG